GRAQVLGIAEMRSHAGAQFGFVDELVGMRAVLEGRLRSEEQRINVGRGATIKEFAGERRQVPQERFVGRTLDLRREVETRLDQRRVAVTGPVAVQVAKLREREVVPGETHAHAPRCGTLMSVSIGSIPESLLDRLLFTK